VGSEQDYNFVLQIPVALQMCCECGPAYFCGDTKRVHKLIRRLMALTLISGLAIPHRHDMLCLDEHAANQQED
jgi:hypothetical protein